MAEKKTTDAQGKKSKKVDTAKKTSFFDKVKGFFSGIAKYIKDSKSELKKVVWPSKKDIKKKTITVIAVVLVAGAVLIILDLIFGGIVHLMIGA